MMLGAAAEYSKTEDGAAVGTVGEHMPNYSTFTFTLDKMYFSLN